MARLIDKINELAEAIKAHEDKISKKEKELLDLKAHLKGLHEAMRLIDPVEKPEPVKKSGLKVKLLDLLEEVGAEGLNSTIAVQMAAERGDEILRESVSSLLSKMVKADACIQHNGRYILRKFEKDLRIEAPRVVKMTSMPPRARNMGL